MEQEDGENREGGRQRKKEREEEEREREREGDLEKGGLCALSSPTY